MSATTIVIPCYNEAERLDVPAFKRFLLFESGCRLLLVNDGSQDRTIERLRSIEAHAPGRVDVLDLPKNGGKAAAVRAGVRLAMEHGADYVGYWDADLATPLSAIGDFVRVLDRRRGIDAVIGCRLPMLGHAIHRQRKRAFLGRIFARTASRVLGIPIRDTQCGAKLFRVCPWTVGAFERPFLTRWIFDVEILARIAQFARGGQAPRLAECIYEQPLDEWQDVAGSRLRARDFLKAPAEMAAIYLRYLSPIASRPPELAPLPSMVISMEQAQRDEAEVRRRAA